MAYADGGEYSIWDVSIDAAQATVTDWSTASTTADDRIDAQTNTNGWSASGLAQVIAFAVKTGDVEVQLDANGDYVDLIDGFTMTVTEGQPAVKLRTATDTVAATVQITAKVR